MTLTKKENKQLIQLRKLALQLYVNKQITHKLCRLILEVQPNDVAYMKSLQALTEDLLRVKGYYCSRERIAYADAIVNEWLKQYRVS